MSESNYYSSNPTNILISSGNHASVEHLDPNNDTSTSVASLSPSIREGGFGICTENYSWITGGISSTSTEIIDNSNYTADVTPGTDLPYMQANGASLSGINYGYLSGDAWSNTVSKFDYSTGVSSYLNELPIRTVRQSGAIDNNYGWILGGIDTTSVVRSDCQKIDLSTDTWSVPAGLQITNGIGKHTCTYKNQSILMAGGISENGMSLSIFSLAVDTDIATNNFRSHLSLSRHDLGSSNTPLNSWWCAGTNISPTAIIDKTDHYNDTTNASYRCDLTYPRSTPIVVGDRNLITNILADNQLESIAVSVDSFSHSIMGMVPYSIGNGDLRIFSHIYISGGQNYTEIYNNIYKIDTTVDSESLINTSLTGRYALSTLYNENYSWYIGGIDSNNNILDTVEKFDHSNESSSVSSTSAISQISYAGDFSTETDGYVKHENNFYSLDFSTDTWSTLTGEGSETFIKGSGISERGVFAGGLNGSELSNRISIYDHSTNSWVNHSSELGTAKFSISSCSNFENTWFIGGTIRSQIDDIESFNYLSNSATVLWRNNLSSAKSRAGSILNNEYVWIVNGYRSSALSDIDKFDPFSDTISVSSRISGLTRHSFGISAPFSYGNKIGSLLKCILPTSIFDDKLCIIPGLRDYDERDSITPSPYDTIYSDTSSIIPHTPEEYGNEIINYYSAGINYTSDIQLVMPVSVTDDLLLYVTMNDPNSEIISECYSSLSIIDNPYVLDDSSWTGGGYNVNYHERIDSGSFTPEVRGQTFLPRMGSAAGSSYDRTWIAGGSISINTIELLFYDNDTVVSGDRTDLSVNRSYLSAFNNSNYCWYWGGIDSNGLVGTIDRLDKSNDTVAAILRANDTPMAKMDSAPLFDKGYTIGGQVGTESKNDVRFIIPDSDTIVNESSNFIEGVYDHVMVNVSDKIILFNNNNVYSYTQESSGEILITNLPSYDRYQANIINDKIWISGGTINDVKLDQTGVYDPSTNTYTSLTETLNYARYNHWQAGRTSSTDISSQSINIIFNSIGLYSNDLTTIIPKCSSEYDLHTFINIGERHNSDIACIAIRPSECHYTTSFENSWICDINGLIWRFEYNLSSPIPTSQTTMSSRRASVSTGQLGYLMGGNAQNVSVVNYTDETVTDLSVQTDDICESVSTINCYDYSLLIGGCRFSDPYTYSLPIIDSVRQWDYITETLSFMDINSTYRRTRSAGSRMTDSNIGYIFGGSINELHDLTDTVEKIDLSTDTFSILPDSITSAADLFQTITNSQNNIITSNGVEFDTSSETTSHISDFQSVFGEAFANQSSNSIFVGGSTERNEDPIIHGKITPGPYNKTLYNYDHVTNTITTGSDIVPNFFDCQPMYPYSYCDPLATLKDGRSGIIHDVYGTYRTWVSTIIERTYTYSDRQAVVKDSLTTENSDVTCIYTAFGSEKINCISVSANTLLTSRVCLLHEAVDHNENDIQNIYSSLGTYYSELLCSNKSEQLLSDIQSVAIFPNFWTFSNDINSHIYIGGHITSRNCYIPACYNANWSLYMNEATTSILDSLIGTGDFVEILHKTIRSGLTNIDIDSILNNISQKFGQKDFIYSIDQSRGTVADEGVLIVPGQNIQIIRLLVKLSGTDMWVSNNNNVKFYLNNSKEYVINGIGNVPITGNIMLVTLKLTEPLQGELGFKFSSARSNCYIKLVSI